MKTQQSKRRKTCKAPNRILCDYNGGTVCCWCGRKKPQGNKGIRRRTRG